ncbi:MAG TPA: PAS domain S-box protein [Candidatus Limnocylindria bacterium]|nr:PAS domain S-box protein [Candidatus Limnocylindria bacterium]
MSGNGPAATGRERLVHRLVMASAATLVLLGVMVLIGWIAHWTVLLQVLPGAVPMQFNTATCFLAAGLALAASSRGNRAIPFVVGLVLIAVGVLTLDEYASGRDTGIDRLLFESYSVVANDHPGRMSIVTAGGFLLAGTVMVMMTQSRKRPTFLMVAASLACALAMAASVVLFAYFIKVEAAYGWELKLRVALHAGIGLLLLGLSLVGICWVELGKLGATVRRWLALIAAVEVLAMVGTNSALAFREMSLDMTRHHQAHVTLLAIETFSQQIEDMQRFLRGFTITGDPAAKVGYTNSLLEIQDKLDKARTLAGIDPPQVGLLDRVASEVGVLLDFNKRRFALRDAGIASGAEVDEVTGKSRASLDRTRDLLSQSIRGQRKLMGEREDIMQRELRDTLRLFAFGACLAGILVLAVLFRAMREVERRQTAENDLRRLNEDLESRVQQRTAALDRANSDIRKAEMTFRLVVDAAPNPLVLLNAEGRIINANRAAEFLFGWDRGVLNGKGVETLLSVAENAPAKPWNPGAAVSSDTVGEGPQDLYFRRRDGSEFPGESNASPVETPDGHFILLSIVNLTDRREAEARSRNLNVELERRVAVRTVELEKTLDLLRANEEHLRHTFDHASIGMALVGLDGRWKRVNRALCELIGYSEAELLQIDFQKITHPEDLEADLRQVRRLVAGDIKNYQMEKRYYHRMGTVVHALLSVTLVRDAEGHPVHFVSQVQDVTQRKHAEQRTQGLLKDLHDMRVAIDQHAIVAITDSEGRIVYANDKFCALSGYLRTELTGQDHRIINSGHHPQSFMAQLWGAITQGKLWQGEICNKAKDGRLYWVDSTIMPFCDEHGVPIQYISIQTDITIRKQTEIALGELSTLQRTILNSANYSIVATDEIGIIRSFNRTAEIMLGYSAEEVVGVTTPAIWHDSKETIRRAAALSAELGRPIEPGFETFVARARLDRLDESEWTLIRKNGARFPVSLSVTPIRDEQGVVTGFLEVIGDITERRRAEIELRRAKEAAEAASKAKAEFLATMSHEIRTPMNGVIGMTSLLLSTELSHEQSGYVETIRNSGESLLVIINDILDFSKIESGKMTLETAPFDLRGCVEQSVDLFAAKAAEKKLRITQRVDSDVPLALVGDVTRVRQVLVNLMGNGIKFTATGGITVTVSRYTGSDPDADRMDPLWHFSVQDTGIGIPSEKFHLLFHSFQQVDSSTTRRFGGTGLGLAISHRLCELMGGRMWVESEAGQGSIFHFTIRAKVGVLDPATSGHGGTYGVGHAGAAGRGKLGEERPLSILMAEDNNVNQMVAQRMLDKLGYRADIVADGQEAIQAMERRAYDVILMDLEMPNVSGYAAARQIRANPRPGRSPWIVALTAHAIDGVKEECFNAGMNDYLAKPIKLEQLEWILRRVPIVSAS